MTKEVTLQELRDHLDERIEDVRNGVTLFLVEDGKKLAEISPPSPLGGQWIEKNGLRYRPAKGDMKDVKLPPPLKPEIDILKYLEEERGDR
jgi:antitoxin (DNA-binding transcriptional repressor) of toxin-antitoxin stability system